MVGKERSTTSAGAEGDAVNSLSTVDMLELACSEVLAMTPEKGYSATEIAAAQVRLEYLIVSNQGAYEQLSARQRAQAKAREEANFMATQGVTLIPGSVTFAEGYIPPEQS